MNLLLMLAIVPATIALLGSIMVFFLVPFALRDADEFNPEEQKRRCQ